MCQQAKFFKLIYLLCEKCELQVTITHDNGKWQFNVYQDTSNQEDPKLPPFYNWDGEDPNQALLNAIPTLIKYFKKLRKIRKRKLEDRCVAWCDKTIKTLELYLKWEGLF